MLYNNLQKYDLSILINNKPVKEYFHEGNTFVEGREKSKFSIKLQNNTGSKIKAIISVDGLSIIDGEEAGIDSQAYVVERYSTQIFEGWRTSMSEIAQFEFASKKKSYSKKIGKGTSNVGVIGAMIFNEIPNYNYLATSTFPLTGGTDYFYGSGNPVTISDTQLRSSETNHPGINSFDSFYLCSQNVSNIGTKFGEEKKSNVSYDYSNFYTTPDEILCLYYDDREGLEKRGIIVDASRSMPNAFPSYLTKDKFAKRPLK